MIELVMSYISQFLILAISFPICVILVGVVFPRVFLQPIYLAKLGVGVGIKKYLIPGGRAVVYRPDNASRRYVKRFALCSIGKDKSLVCKYARRFSSIRYTVTAFDASDRVIGAIDVREKLGGDIISERVSLPSATAYVALGVREINGEALSDGVAPVGYRIERIAAFLALTVACAVAEAYFVSSALALWFPSNVLSSGVALSLSAGALGAGYALLVIKRRLSADAKAVLSKASK